MPKNDVNYDWMNDWQRPAGAEPEGPAFLVGQWFNGGQGGDSPVLKSGGWELPSKWFSPVLGDAYPVSNVEHSGAQTDDGAEPAYLFPVLHLAVVMKYVDFYRGMGQERVWSPEYQEGFYSRVKLLCFAKEIEAVKPLTPLIVTFRSSVARDFGAVARQFRTEVIDPAQALAVSIAQARGLDIPQKFLPYAFWLPVGSGGTRVKTGNGQKSMYAPLVGYWDSDTVKSDDRDEVIAELQNLATPPDIRQYVATAFYDEAKAWLEEERSKLQQTGTGEPDDVVVDDEPEMAI